MCLPKTSCNEQLFVECIKDYKQCEAGKMYKGLYVHMAKYYVFFDDCTFYIGDTQWYKEHFKTLKIYHMFDDYYEKVYRDLERG